MATETESQYDERRCPLPCWMARLGLAGVLFFLVKGLLWLAVPAALAYWAAN